MAVTSLFGRRDPFARDAKVALFFGPEGGTIMWNEKKGPFLFSFLVTVRDEYAEPVEIVIARRSVGS